MDIQPLVHLAFYEGIQPRKGFDWILGRYGLCNAITTLGGQDLSQTPEVREYCIQRLVRALYQELCERLGADIERREGAPPPAGASVRQLMAGRAYLFLDAVYHVDGSHPPPGVPRAVHPSPPAGPRRR